MASSTTFSSSSLPSYTSASNTSSSTNNTTPAASATVSSCANFSTNNNNVVNSASSASATSLPPGPSFSSTSAFPSTSNSTAPRTTSTSTSAVISSSSNGSANNIRPRTGERPSTRDQGDFTMVIPSRTSSLHSRIAQPTPSSLNIASANNSHHRHHSSNHQHNHHHTPRTLTHAYMVCGVGREPSQWIRAPPPPQGKITHMKNSTGHFFLPEILGSSPRLEQDLEIARSLHAAMRACFPHDIEICTGKVQPHCVHHSFVLQQNSSHTLYGIALRVWSRADGKRAETFRELRKKIEPEFHDNSDETYWIPYCLSFLSRYPLYNLLGDYLRGMWIHWNKATNLFHAEEVSRILSFPAPRLNDLVRIDMKDYALFYQFPSSPTGFQNFALWPLFCCLSIPNIVGVVEAALSASRRIIFVSHYLAMLTMAAETVRFFVRVYEWSGLYVPVVYAHRIQELVQEPGPYILGVTAECRTLFTAPADSLIVDLDRNFVLTSSPPCVFTARQRIKMIKRLTQALNSEVIPSGVPQHLRFAYGGGKLVPAGQIVVMKGDVENVQDPDWWNQDAVMGVMDHVCEKLCRFSGIRALFGGSMRKPLMTKVSIRHLDEIIRERNQYSRDAVEAWQDYVNAKGRMDMELAKVTKRSNFLSEELDNWKQQFLKFQAFVEQLTKETQDLKIKIESHKREKHRLMGLIDQHKEDSARLAVRLSGTEKQRNDALEALVLQQEIAEELEKERERNARALSALQQTNMSLTRQRDEAQRVVLHLRALIDGQAHHMEHIVKSLVGSSEVERTMYSGGVSGKRMTVVSEVDEEEDRKPSGKLDSGFETAGEELERAENTDTVVSPIMENQLLNENNGRVMPRDSVMLTDSADRLLREKTDAIAYIIRSISEQCAAAVEGLDLAQKTDEDDELLTDDLPESLKLSDEATECLLMENVQDGSSSTSGVCGKVSVPSGLHTANASNGSIVEGNAKRESVGLSMMDQNGLNGGFVSRQVSHDSSVPPTPDLIHPDRSSTSMSLTSGSTSNLATPDRHSLLTSYGAVGVGLGANKSNNNGSRLETASSSSMCNDTDSEPESVSSLSDAPEHSERRSVGGGPAGTTTGGGSGAYSSFTAAHVRKNRADNSAPGLRDATKLVDSATDKSDRLSKPSEKSINPPPGTNKAESGNLMLGLTTRIVEDDELDVKMVETGLLKFGPRGLVVSPGGTTGESGP